MGLVTIKFCAKEDEKNSEGRGILECIMSNCILLLIQVAENHLACSE